jgi:tetratricopeptide (TPR) repeat protein
MNRLAIIVDELKTLYNDYQEAASRPAQGQEDCFAAHLHDVGYVEAEALSPAAVEAAKKLRMAISQAVSAYPDTPDVLAIASSFHFQEGDIDEAMDLVKRWMRVDKSSVGPIVAQIQMYFEDCGIPYEEFKCVIKEGLMRRPRSPYFLLMGYEGAYREKDDARRLFYAIELAGVTGDPDDMFRYGKELGQNFMLDKALAAFTMGQQKNPKHFGCACGVAYTRLLMLDLDEAEQLFETIHQAEKTDFVSDCLRDIERLRKGKSVWTDAELRLNSLFDSWSNDELRRITCEEQNRLSAECVAKR